jgi:hypothetical protein
MKRGNEREAMKTATKRGIRILGNGTEWVESYHTCGRVMTFTQDATKAARYNWDYEPSTSMGLEALKAARNLYGRTGFCAAYGVDGNEIA